MQQKKRTIPEVNAGSMADIAFLLLIFFLVTTTILQEKGLSVLLPPAINRESVDVNDRNLLKILVNSKNQILLEDEPITLDKLKNKAMLFLNNYQKDANLSDSPDEAVISLKTDRGTAYWMYIQVLDEIKSAYHELRAKTMNCSLESYLNFDTKKANKAAITNYEAAKAKYPMRISEAEPTQVIQE